MKLKSLGKTGVVQRQVDGNAFEVAMGPMKMRVAREDIAEVHPGREIRAVSPLEAAAGAGSRSPLRIRRTTVRPELNVIGRTVEEATGEVEQYLDRAFLAGLPRVRIVHGMGMGVLRKALRALMERHPHVALVAEASPSEGGAGQRWSICGYREWLTDKRDRPSLRRIPGVKGETRDPSRVQLDRC